MIGIGRYEGSAYMFYVIIETITHNAGLISIHATWFSLFVVQIAY